MATTSGHTLKAFDQDLDQLRACIAEMGGRAEPRSATRWWR
jgi:phosphate transport system protein